MPKVLTEEGIYRGNILKWGLVAAGTGTLQWSVIVEVKEKAKDADDLEAGWDVLEKPLKRTVFNAITQNTIHILTDTLKSLDFNDSNLLNLDPKKGPSPYDFQGKQVLLSCEHDTYNNRDMERWRFSRRKVRTLTADQMDTMVNLYGDMFKEDMTDTGSAGQFFQNKAETFAK